MKFVSIFPCFAVMATGLLSAVAQADEPSAKLRGFTEVEHRMLATTLPPDLGGERLLLADGHFTSTSTAGVVMSANLTLVLPTDYTSGTGTYEWKFTLAGPFVTAASTNVVFVKNTDSGQPIANDVAIDYGTDDDCDCVMRTEFLRLAKSVKWELGTGAVTIGADSIVAGSIKTTAGVMTLGAGAVVTGAMKNSLGAVGLGANAKSGPITAGAGAVALGANAEVTKPAGAGGNKGTRQLAAGSPTTKVSTATQTDGTVWCWGMSTVARGDIMAMAGAVGLGANAKTGNIEAKAGAITLGAAAETGALFSPGAAITIAAGAIANGDVTSGFAVTFGAGGLAKGLVKAGGAITFGAGSGSCGYCSVAATTVGATPVYPVEADCADSCIACRTMLTTRFPVSVGGTASPCMDAECTCDHL